MNQPEHPADLDVERLVRARLERGAEAIDPRPLFGRRSEQSLVVSVARAVGRGRSPALCSERTWKWAGAAQRRPSIVVGLAVLMHERTGSGQGRDGRPRGARRPTCCRSTGATSWR